MTKDEDTLGHANEEDDEDLDEFEVVELESEEGELEEYVIIDRLALEDKMYAVMALLEEVEAAEAMSEEEFEENFGEEGLVFLMREEEDSYIELNEEENKKVKELMDQRIAENEAALDEDD